MENDGMIKKSRTEGSVLEIDGRPDVFINTARNSPFWTERSNEKSLAIPSRWTTEVDLPAASKTPQQQVKDSINQHWRSKRCR